MLRVGLAISILPNKTHFHAVGSVGVSFCSRNMIFFFVSLSASSSSTPFPCLQGPAVDHFPPHTLPIFGCERNAFAAYDANCTCNVPATEIPFSICNCVMCKARKIVSTGRMRRQFTRIRSMSKHINKPYDRGHHHTQLTSLFYRLSCSLHYKTIHF